MQSLGLWVLGVFPFISRLGTLAEYSGPHALHNETGGTEQHILIQTIDTLVGIHKVTVAYQDGARSA